MAEETKLSQRMNALGMSDRALAELSGIERSMITKMRHGKATPSLQKAMVVCDLVGLRPEDLLMKEEKP